MPILIKRYVKHSYVKLSDGISFLLLLHEMHTCTNIIHIIYFFIFIYVLLNEL